jgi:hypothetical protein
VEPVDVDTAADVVGIRGQRILLANAVARYTLLAMVPLFVVLLMGPVARRR